MSNFPNYFYDEDHFKMIMSHLINSITELIPEVESPQKQNKLSAINAVFFGTAGVKVDEIFRKDILVNLMEKYSLVVSEQYDCKIGSDGYDMVILFDNLSVQDPVKSRYIQIFNYLFDRAKSVIKTLDATIDNSLLETKKTDEEDLHLSEVAKIAKKCKVSYGFLKTLIENLCESCNGWLKTRICHNEEMKIVAITNLKNAVWKCACISVMDDNEFRIHMHFGDIIPSLTDIDNVISRACTSLLVPHGETAVGLVINIENCKLTKASTDAEFTLSVYASDSNAVRQNEPNVTTEKFAHVSGWNTELIQFCFRFILTMYIRLHEEYTNSTTLIRY